MHAQVEGTLTQLSTVLGTSMFLNQACYHRVATVVSLLQGHSSQEMLLSNDSAVKIIHHDSSMVR